MLTPLGARACHPEAVGRRLTIVLETTYPCHRPVSYTHLDVYKRQAQRRVVALLAVAVAHGQRLGRRLLAADNGHVGHAHQLRVANLGPHPIAAQIGAHANARLAQLGGQDVYKRQAEQGESLKSSGSSLRGISRYGIERDEFLANALGISVETLEAAQLEVYEAELAARVAAGELTCLLYTSRCV